MSQRGHKLNASPSSLLMTAKQPQLNRRQMNEGCVSAGVVEAACYLHSSSSTQRRAWKTQLTAHCLLRALLLC